MLPIRLHFVSLRGYYNIVILRTYRKRYFLDKNNNNSILNLQLLDANENESKNDMELGKWVKFESEKQNISIEKFCENHLIPNILEFSKFDDFIKERKVILMDKMKEIIN